jgi:cold shock CspA family protein
MLQESLFVMHSSILQEDTALNSDQRSGFWTGHPPSWHEINAGIDIRRTITDKIIKRVTEFLKSPPSRTIFITQKPGMGGTTILRRVAWEFHKICPVTLIERDAPSLPQRLKTLHELAGRSILVIVEGSCLTEARFEEIYNTAFKDNIRSVFIYLRKDFSNFLQPCGGNANPLSLPDPLDEGEAELFLSRFQKLTNDHIRLSELEKITRIGQFQRYRIPFFYGLITFERDFNGIDHFVQQHLQGLHHRLVGLFQYLAIVTRYSSESLPASFVNHFLRVNQRLQLREILPEGPSRLIISSDNKLRLLHPLIAEQVLEALEPGGTGDRWIESLYSISIDLIGRLHEYSSELNQEIQDLLIALFINRQGAPLPRSEQKTLSLSAMEDTGAEDIFSQDGQNELHLTEDEQTEEPIEEEREGFSPIIMRMISVHKHQGRQVFDELVEKYPDDPHFWNHRGRYYMYGINDLEIAQKSLLEAIERSGHIDHVHFHTYGLVKKHQIFRKLREFTTAATPHEVFLAISPDYLAAEQAFLEARKLNPESVYAYISHIQLILGVLNRIRSLSNYPNLSQIDPTTQRLVMDRIGQVNDMLDSIHQIYLSSSRQRIYLKHIEASLKEFYGDLGGVIRLWEEVLASGSVTHHARRALCKAYLARKEGNWGRLEMVELRRMKNICEENLAGPHWRDNDVLWWFQATMRIPGQDRKTLIAKLSDWQTRPLWSVGYLLSILHFLEWIDGKEGAEREFQNTIERCRELVYGRKRFCRFYLATGTGELPLVDVIDLEREKQTRWFVDDQAMKRLNGLISEVIPSGDRPPHIVIEGVFHVPFFNDGNFKKFQDENVEVSFLLGFSPMGMRAFKVTRGAVEGGNRKELAAHLNSRRRAIDTDDHMADPQWIDTQVNILTREQIGDLAIGFVSARSQWGAQITVAELQNLVEASLGFGSTPRRLGFDNFEELLRSYGTFTFEPQGGYCYLGLVAAAKGEESQATCGAEEGLEIEEPPTLGVVVLLNPTKRFGFIEDKNKPDANGPDYWFRFSEAPEVESGRIKRGDLVCFLPSVNDRGLIANKVRLADKISTRNDAPIGVHKLMEKPCSPSEQSQKYIARPTISKEGKEGLKRTKLGCTDEPFLDEVQRYLVQLVKSHGGILNSSEAGILLNKEYPSSIGIRILTEDVGII